MIAYNQAAYIERAIRSVLEQKTDFPFELVIGEDFSNDGTREIVLGLAARHPEQIRIVPRDGNVGPQRNEAETEKLCRGDYIAYCEGDDFWHDPQKLQLQHDLLEQDPQVGLVYSDYDRYYPRNQSVKRRYNESTDNQPPENISVEEIVRGGKSLYILTCTVMLRRSLLEQALAEDAYLFKREGIRVRDTSVWAEIAARSKVKYINRSLATYTVNAESASKSSDRSRRLRFSREVNDIARYLARKHAFTQASQLEFQTRWAKATLRLGLIQIDPTLLDVGWRSLPPRKRGLGDRLIYALGKSPLRRFGKQIDSLLRR